MNVSVLPPKHVKCANEHHNCFATSSQKIYYGAGDSYLVKAGENKLFICDNDQFGGDPNPGVVKS